MSEQTALTVIDETGRSGAPFSSHSFVKNLKAYAEEVGIKHIGSGAISNHSPR